MSIVDATSPPGGSTNVLSVVHMYHHAGISTNVLLLKVDVGIYT